MKQQIKPSVGQQTKQQKKVSTPWWAGLEVKDLVNPINLRRIHLMYSGMVMLILAGIGYYTYENFLRQPTGIELVSEMVESAGGMEAWNNIRTGQFARTRHLYDEAGTSLSNKEEIYWSDHKTVNGITFSHKWTRHWANGQLMEEYIFSDVDFET